MQKLSDDILLLKDDIVRVQSCVASSLTTGKVDKVLEENISASNDAPHMTNEQFMEEDIDLIDISDNSMDYFVPLETITGEKPALN